MKKLHKFILKSYIGPLVLTFFIAIFILLMQFLWKWIDELVGKGLDWTIIAELMWYAAITLIPMALPLAILLSSIMIFGNLAENYELVALKSAGISLSRIMTPLIYLIILISIGAFLFSNYIMPYSYLKMSTLLIDIRHHQPELSIKEGVFSNDIDGYSIRIEDKDEVTGLLKNIMIYDHTSKRGNVQVTVADSGYMSMTENKTHLILDLFNGYTYSESQDKKKKKTDKTHPLRRDKFEEQKLMFQMDPGDLKRTDEGLFKKHYQMLNLRQLSIANDSLLKEFQNRKQTFSDNLIRTSYFKKERKIHDKTDTISTTHLTPSQALSLDSLFNNLDPKRKEQVIALATNYARSAKSYIASTQKSLFSRKKWIKRHQIEWHRKFTLSFACFVLFFIGAPLGAIIRKGGLGMPVVISVIFFILYYLVSITGEKFAREDIFTAFEGMWLSSVILLPLGIFLTNKAANDSSILNIDTYLQFLKHLFLPKNKTNK